MSKDNGIYDVYDVIEPNYEIVERPDGRDKAVRVTFLNKDGEVVYSCYPNDNTREVVDNRQK